MNHQSETSRGATASQPGVLVVDDVEANLLAMKAVLQGLPCHVVLARSGSEGLQRLLTRDFAVMLLDVHMPEMNGFEMAAVARSNPGTRDVPVIFLTAAHPDEDKVLRGYGSGAVDFMFKPVNIHILRSKVSVFLELYEKRRQIVEAKTRLEHAYDELQRSQAQLVQSAKMASLGTLVAGVAHEINNPLSFALSHLNTVQKSLDQLRNELDPRPSESSKEHWSRASSRLTELASGLNRIRDLVVKLRTFSRLDEGERKQASMRASVESVLTILEHRMKGRIRVECHFGEPDQLECFPGPLNQALMNLVSNAIDAIEDGGTIHVSTGKQGAAYVISITDTGRGIPAHLFDRVLEPFFTTKPVGEGTGLGLFITYSIVQKHEGTLELRPVKNGGTEALIRLPLDVQQSP